MAVKQALTYSEDEARIIRNASIGDIIVLGGQRVRLRKKTNQAVAVEPYTWLNVAEDWFLEKMHKLLP